MYIKLIRNNGEQSVKLLREKKKFIKTDKKNHQRYSRKRLTVYI